MGEMTASIAHEVNQPLAAIVANGNAGLRWLASKTPDLDEVQASLERVIADGHRASEVIGSIRAMFKKEDHGKARLDINELVHEILALVQGELQINRISVQTDLAPDLPEVLGDRIQLQQVILNLIMNAIEAMISVEGRARALRVSSEQRGPDGVLMSVADSGTGIDSKTIDRIFEPLYTTKPDGMGMGLSICRSIIQAHRGQLSASAGHPHGSVFQVVLPTAQFAE
jgi:signal transduction histidine kinase